MSTSTITIARDFAEAVADYFNLPKDKTSSDIKLHTSRDDIFSVEVNIALNGDDLIEIGKLMNINKEGE